MVNKDLNISIRCQCEILDISRSSFYYHGKPESEENLAIMRIIDERHLQKPTHGVLRMEDYLRSRNYHINEKRVRRLMRKMGIETIYPKRNLSKLGHAKWVYPYLLRNMDINCPNQVWAIDITYIPMQKGFMYLVAIIDLYSRFVVGWSISNTMTSDWVLAVVEEAISKHGKPQILNSDQGSQFTCKDWVSYLKKEQIQISMDGKGRATDNAFIERLWRRVKYDYVYLNPADNGIELYDGLKQYFHEYNFMETHQGIERKVPVELYLKKEVA